MAQGGGVPGVAVGMAGIGVLLIYAGYKGTNPLDALRSVASGKPSGLAAQSAAHQALYTGIGNDAGLGTDTTGTGGVAQTSFTGVSGPHPEFVAASAQFAGDRYSQLKRWQPGYSDCSSFVGKSLKAAGVTPPGSSVTSSYLTWRMAHPIDKSQIGAGDFLVSSGHMVLAMNNTVAIGQQNESVNVEIGPISQLMWGQSWVALRYTGASGSGAGSVMA